jgi:hypothetical protein
MRDSHRRRRDSIRFRPVLDLAGDGASVLDRRLLLSGDVARGAHASLDGPHAHPLARHAARAEQTRAGAGRTTPSQEINKQYDLFLQNYDSVLNSYVNALTQQSTGTVSVSTPLTAPYLAGSAQMTVQDGSVFGPQGTFSLPVTATAQVGTVPVGTFSITGRSGNVLAINTTQSSAVSLGVGTILTAQVTFTAASSAGSIVPGYITVSTQQLAVNLESYFNSLPIKLPRKYAPPHQPRSGGAIQQYVNQILVGAASTSLEQTLLAVSLPLTPGGDLDIYEATVATAVNASRVKMLDSVQQIFANKLPVVPQNLISGTTSGTSATSTASSSTTGTGTTGAA